MGVPPYPAKQQDSAARGRAWQVSWGCQHQGHQWGVQVVLDDQRLNSLCSLLDCLLHEQPWHALTRAQLQQLLVLVLLAALLVMLPLSLLLAATLAICRRGLM